MVTVELTLMEVLGIIRPGDVVTIAHDGISSAMIVVDHRSLLERSIDLGRRIKDLEWRSNCLQGRPSWTRV